MNLFSPVPKLPKSSTESAHAPPRVPVLHVTLRLPSRDLSNFKIVVSPPFPIFPPVSLRNLFKFHAAHTCQLREPVRLGAQRWLLHLWSPGSGRLSPCLRSPYWWNRIRAVPNHWLVTQWGTYNWSPFLSLGNANPALPWAHLFRERWKAAKRRESDAAADQWEEPLV